MITLPRKGKENRVKIIAQSGASALLGKCSSGCGWFLSVKPRCRFGNAQQIREDVQHFIVFGNLPEQKTFGF